MNTEESLDFWKDAPKAVQGIFEALDLLNNGGIYTEKTIYDEIIKNHNGTSEELNKKIKVKTKEIFTKTASKLSNMVNELKGLGCDISNNIPEPYKDRYEEDKEYEFWEGGIYEEVECAIAQAYTTIEALEVATNIFKDTDSEDISNHIRPFVNKLFDVKNTVYVDIAEGALNDLEAVLNNQKPTFSTDIYSSSSTVSNFIWTVKRIGLKQEGEIYKLITKNHFEIDADIIEDRIKDILSNIF